MWFGGYGGIKVWRNEGKGIMACYVHVCCYATMTCTCLRICMCLFCCRKFAVGKIRRLLQSAKHPDGVALFRAARYDYFIFLLVSPTLYCLYSR